MVSLFSLYFSSKVREFLCKRFRHEKINTVGHSLSWALVDLIFFLSFFKLKVPSVRVEIHLPRDQSGEVDFNALVSQLKETSSFQEQADILYMLYTMK